MGPITYCYTTPGWKGLPVTNTLAYWALSKITTLNALNISINLLLKNMVLNKLHGSTCPAYREQYFLFTKFL
jgi:hypothetical protein